MTDFHHDEDEERGTLRDRLPHLSVPASLHARVRDSLRSRELIRDSRLRGTWRRPATLAAAAVLCFAAGLFAGRQAPTQAAVAVTPKYALLLYGGAEADSSAPDRSRAVEYGRWAAGLSGDAAFVSGEELGRVVGELPNQSGREPVAGFFLIDAGSDAIAMQIARDCPHLKYGGRVVVQAIGG
jgi:hypothetical protein